MSVVSRKTTPLNSNKLPPAFYQREDVTEVACQLLGKVLTTRFNGQLTSGMIVEVEAYAGRNDKACHANNNRRTGRTEIMYAAGGVSYVYLCYGIHHLFNVVTNVEGMADAVLVRALEPLEGVEVMMQRRKMNKPAKRLTSGPGVLTQALGITTRHDGTPLFEKEIWIEDRGIQIPASQIGHSRRIGVEYAEQDAAKLWRYYLKENPWVSKI